MNTATEGTTFETPDGISGELTAVGTIGVRGFDVAMRGFANRQETSSSFDFSLQLEALFSRGR